MTAESTESDNAYTPRLTEAARQYLTRVFPNGEASELAATDPEFVERFANFACDEVVNGGAPEGEEPLDDRTRFIAILATLLGCQGVDQFRVMLGAALDMGVTPSEAKEIVYQAVAYLGIGRVLPFFNVTNEVLTQHGVTLPLTTQATTEPDFASRVAAGEQAQVDIFGEGMKGFATSGNPEYPQINRWLAANCFGDYYTRGALDLREREMITYCYLAAQGGVEPQLTAHAKANMRIGNSKAFLLKVASAVMPFIGYPRTLNAIRCIETAAADQ
ncbi:carboxymuconolactone decarboxylase family protein [Bifidobacterium sp. LC6]|uniref:Carboxymuconolactone decarboxylase family protein n=1 Tax=Bifidobacterium colobi TaxID=2809026 RepID=A0ABS5UVE8_9BIFI|nr:carboxymuconolactone decarboxylase family protein [Bifidobacterium colobi]MBT1175057.1 carboxymuconolactone decarboxylase family protein [Bifidobacterium colobi]